MKRTVSLILILCLAAALFAGCETVTAAVEIAQALDKTRALDSIDAEIVTTLTMSAEGKSETMSSTVNMQADGLKSDSPKLSVKSEAAGQGYTSTTHIYLEDQWAYYAMDGFKYKMKLEDAGDETDYTETVTELMQDIPAELLENVKLEKQSDGSRTVTITMTDEQISEIYENTLEGITGTLGNDLDDLIISNGKVTVAVKGGYVTKYALQYHVSVEALGVKAEADAEVSVTLKNPGSKVTVTPPEGYQDFPDLSGLGSLG